MSSTPTVTATPTASATLTPTVSTAVAISSAAVGAGSGFTAAEGTAPSVAQAVDRTEEQVKKQRDESSTFNFVNKLAGYQITVFKKSMFN